MRGEKDGGTRPDGTDSAGDPASSGPELVIKIGGSLLELPDLAQRLRGQMAQLGTPRLILVVGGGEAADLVRRRYEFDRLVDEEAHWLGIRAMAFNSHLVQALLPGSRFASDLGQCRACWSEEIVPILDPYAFVRQNEVEAQEPLPHDWSVTSDSIAARVARTIRADRLVLLKSVSVPAGLDWCEAARRGIVDRYFPEEIRRPPRVPVRVVNLRGELRQVLERSESDAER